MLGKTIHSAKKTYVDKKKELRKEYIETEILSASLGYGKHKWIRPNDSAPRVNIFSLHDRNVYRDIEWRNWDPMPQTTRKWYRNNLRRKTIMLSKSRKAEPNQKDS